MKTIALITQKGGCGKTTLTTCLAVEAARKGKKALILDTDPQGTASQWWESRDSDSPSLIETKGDEIAQAIKTAESKGFDLVLIDTPARAEPVNAAAAQVADFCLIPCQPSLADMRAQSPTVQTVQRLEKHGAFILNRCPPRGPRAKEAERGLLVFGLPVAPVTIGNRSAYSDAYASGLGVTEYEPEGKAAGEITALWQWITRQLGRRA
jgi:chromosome partitioning protein